MLRNCRKSIMKWVEIIFDLSYLFTVFIAAVLLYITAEVGSLRWLYALMAFTLVCGDAFHLIPRIYLRLDPKERKYAISLGIGKFITSITMTIFYLFLLEIGKRYYELQFNLSISLMFYSLAVLRIFLCILPQNRWKEMNQPQKWAIYRNIPFVILGLFVMIVYMIGSIGYSGGLSHVWIAILISFFCYIPVVLYSKRYPKVGMLMLPKSCAYVAIVLMGFNIT